MSSNSSTREKKRRNKKSFPSPSRSRPASPVGSFAPPLSAASLVDRELLTEELSLFEALEISPENQNPRSFPYSVKQQCWEKADKIKGRDPDRWRRDPLGNIVFRKLVGCPGCLCHDYDHIVPYSKGGKSTLENCQVLQVNLCLLHKLIGNFFLFGIHVPLPLLPLPLFFYFAKMTFVHWLGCYFSWHMGKIWSL
ncbi:hypothetical protein Pfo_020629 [Paulownia fortunei]|nr:hypothetical protein Pfo_020629 [Paulownia fortunei]